MAGGNGGGGGGPVKASLRHNSGRGVRKSCIIFPFKNKKSVAREVYGKISPQLTSG